LKFVFNNIYKLIIGLIRSVGKGFHDIAETFCFSLNLAISFCLLVLNSNTEREAENDEVQEVPVTRKSPAVGDDKKIQSQITSFLRKNRIKKPFISLKILSIF